MNDRGVVLVKGTEKINYFNNACNKMAIEKCNEFAGFLKDKFAGSAKAQYGKK